MKICAASAAITTQHTMATGDLTPRFYSRALLVDESMRPFKASGLIEGENYVFHYPFEATPCFLLNLGKPTLRRVRLLTEAGASYEWPGGVGPRNAIVAYSAICAHRMSYPTRQISFISYRAKSTASQTARRNMIHCCSEHSEYDPASGARVVGGPAPQPLSAIILDHDAKNDTLHAVGTLGGELFNAFFDKFEFRLALDYGGSRVKHRIAGETGVMRLDNFSKQQVRC